ncbi:MAG: ABC transporter permease [Gemmatimonadetes bacterium]|nr:ABC transporter permease [Gemmatimonadota bacterium]
MDWRDVRRALSPREAIEEDVEEELRFHIEERVRELVASGTDEAEAREEVLEKFGDVRTLEEMCRRLNSQRVDDEERRGTMEALVRDFRLALRTMARSSGFTATVVVTLALAIGATTAIFGVLEAVALRALPFAGADRLAIVWQNDRATGTVREAASTSDYYDYLERSRTFDDLAIFSTSTAVLSRDDAPALQLNSVRASQNVFSVLGVEPRLGRGFTQEEDLPDGPLAVLLAEAAWIDLYGGDPAVVGRTITVDDEAHEVVGVLPEEVEALTGEADIWLPIRQSPAIATRPQHWVRVVGRLGPDVAMEAAQAEMAGIMADLEVEFADDNANRGAFVEPLADVGRSEARTTLWVLFAAVLAVLAIACVNVANLLLARGAGRMKELAVLTAVGAGAADVRRRFFMEALLTTSLASVLGVGLAAVGNRLLFELAPAELQALGQPELNLPVLAFVLAVTALICVGFGLLPSLQARKLDLQAELKDGRTTGGRAAALGLRRVLVAAQLALAVSLLLGATLLIGTVRNLQGVDPGFQAEQMVRADFALPAGRYPEDMSRYPDWPEINGLIVGVEEAVEAVPGVRSVSVVLNHPLDRGFTNSFQVEGRAYDPTQGEMTTRMVTPSYFSTVGLALLEGRTLSDTDRVGEPGVIVLNREAATRYFPEGDAVGSRIGFWGQFREVVGVVANERVHGLTADPPPAMYISMYQAPPRGGRITLMARTEVPPLSVADGLRAAVHTVDSEVPVFNITTMEETLAEAMGRERFATTVLVVFAGVAVFLAILGVHGVLAYLVAQRGHEVGVRMALGATRSDVVRLVLRQGATMTVVGIVAGCLVFMAAAGLLQTLLYGVSVTSPVMYLGVALTLGVAAMAGSALPAMRAASIDPVKSLRSE